MTKLKRVRTGCLTCRERHLKCDEAAPICVNCRKSGRDCKRGVRVSFLDIMVHYPSTITYRGPCKGFCDESRLIAAGYRGGLQRYGSNMPAQNGKKMADHRQHLEQSAEVSTAGWNFPEVEHKHHDRYKQYGQREKDNNKYDHRQHIEQAAEDSPAGWKFPSFEHNHHDRYRQHGQREWRQFAPSPGKAGVLPTHFKWAEANQYALTSSDSDAGNYLHSTRLWGDDYAPQNRFVTREEPHQLTPTSSLGLKSTSLSCQYTPSSSDSFGSAEEVRWPDSLSAGPDNENDYTGEAAASPDELELLQSFIDGVGVWMDAMDERKFFTQVIPLYAFKSPVIYNALLACGAKHLSTRKPELEDRAVTLYNTATAQLVRTLQNPDREMADCAAASILLNVYEAMCHTPIRNMSHMLGARALILECGWDATSTGIPAACYWLSMGMEVQYCLSMRCPMTVNPDDWGLGYEWSSGDDSAGTQTWVLRSFYVLAKVTNFRATKASLSLHDAAAAQSTLSARLAEWQALKRLCDGWSTYCPEAMRPASYRASDAKRNLPCFPNFWLAQPSATLGRIFYHTAQCILAQGHPIESCRVSPELKQLEQHHSRQILGIVVSNDDKAVAVVATQAVHVALAALVTKKDREDVCRILAAIKSYRLGQSAGHDREANNLMELFREWRRPDGADLRSDSNLSATFAAALHPQDNLRSSPGSRLMMRSEDTTAALPVNPLESAYFGHANQPYNMWYQPANSREDVKNFGFKIEDTVHQRH